MAASRSVAGRRRLDASCHRIPRETTRCQASARLTMPIGCHRAMHARCAANTMPTWSPPVGDPDRLRRDHVRDGPDHPPVRATRHRAVPGGQHPGLPASVPGRGGHRGRCLRGPAAIGLHREHPSGPRPRHRQGPRAAADDGRAAGPRDRLLPRSGRIDARVQPRAPEPGCQRRRRRRHAPRGGRRVRHPAQGRDGHRGLLLQRRRVRQRRLPRSAQPRGHLSPAGRVRAREQPLRGVDAHPRLGAGGRPVGACRGLRHAGCHGGRQRRACWCWTR